MISSCSKNMVRRSVCFLSQQTYSQTKKYTLKIPPVSLSHTQIATKSLQSNIKGSDSGNTLSPILAIALLSLFWFGQENETQEIERLAKELGILEAIPEELLKEKCFEAAYKLCRQGKWELIKKHTSILNKLTDGDGDTLLAYAILSRELTIAQKLIEMGIGKDKKDRRGNTPLHLAAQEGLSDVIPLLIESVNAVNHSGATPLHLAIKNDQQPTLETLLRLGGVLTNYEDLTPIELSIVWGAKKSFHFLCTEQEIQTLIKEKTLLHFAIEKQSTGMLKPILEKGGTTLIEQRDAEGRTPLELAAYLGDEESLRILFEKGAHLNHLVPLQWAIEGGHRNTLAYLLELSKGIDKEALHQFALRKGKDSMTHFIEKRILGKKWTPKDQPPENLVIKGGGPKGIAFIGALEELEKSGALKNLKRLVGTSSGAIVSSLLSVGYTSKEIATILQDNPLDTLLDPPDLLKEDLQHLLSNLDSFKNELEKISNEGVSNNKWKIGTKLLRNYWWYCEKKETLEKQWNKGGLCKGDHFFELINQEINKKVEAVTGEKNAYLTFGQLQGYIDTGKYSELKHLVVVATKIGLHPENMIFSSLDKKCENIIIASAVRASMSIPFVFEPARISEFKNGVFTVNETLGTFVDGGLLDNYPIDALDSAQYKQGINPESKRDDPWVNPYTWGLNLYSPEGEIKSVNERSDVKSVLLDCIQTYLNAEGILKKNKGKTESRTININNLGVSLIDFTKNPQRDQKLIESGQSAVRKFLAGAKLSRLGKSPIYYNFEEIKKKKEAGKFNLSSAHSCFVNRTSLLQKIKNSLSVQNICVLSGPPGHGKSVLANAYAYANAEKYSLIFWINSETQHSQEIDYHALAHTLNIPIQEGESMIPLPDLKKQIYQKLDNSQEPYLLILDNVEQLPINLPEKGSILITTRKMAPNHIPITPFSLDEACTLLKETTGERRSPAMEYLAEQLHLSPLLVRMAAHAIALDPSNDLSSYLNALKKNRKNLCLSTEVEYSKSLKAAYALTLEQISKEEPRTIEVLNNLAHLSPVHIPVDLIDAYLGCTIKSSSDRECQREKILKVLEQYSLITWDKGESFSMHRQTQEIIKLNKSSCSTMIELLNDYSPVAEYNPMDRGTLTPFKKVLPHCVALMNGPITNPNSKTRLGLTLSRYYIESEGNLDQAENCLKQIEELPQFETITGRIHFYRGMIQRKKGRHKEAREEFEKAQKCFYKDTEASHYRHLEQNHLKCSREYQIAITQSYFAQSLKDEDKKNLEQLSTVYSLLEESKEKISMLLGKNHFDIGRILREQGEIQFLLGKYPAAKDLLDESIISQEAAYKELFFHKPPVAATYLVLGDLHQKMGSLNDAIEAYEEVLKINKNIYGESHRYVARAYRKLAQAHRADNKIDIAQRMEEKALEIEKKLT